MANRARNDSDATSPMHFGMSGNLSADDLQELLGLIPSHVAHERQEEGGAVYGHHHHHNSAEASSAAAGTGMGMGIGHPPNGHHHRHHYQQVQQPSGLQSPAEEETEGAVQARSERKRSREKQRRCDVNKQFSDLTEVVKRIELEESQAHLEQQQQQTTTGTAEAPSSGGGDSSVAGAAATSASSAAPPRRVVLPLPSLPAFSPANRVDLMVRTIAHLERLHLTTKNQREQIRSLEEQLQLAQIAGEETAQKLKEAQQQQQQSGGMGGGMMHMIPAQKQQQHQQVRRTDGGWEGHGLLFSRGSCIWPLVRCF